ncbi:hypothetical protein DSM02_2110 [Leeuwenhoekiella polynyae]|uniref:Outer membrane protein with beta-barrel domain n=1 Tax=Leeuwenhoekiella polynyae TaxID=1550906 RepID=A0A4Q0P5H5_9FLAO|nr:hypothetical protein [Leeuwenhoekiella polynyae]RXG21863.1 hypothetical protein DSM02_2110 [Leeuwenhoekiella polynyae]
MGAHLEYKYAEDVNTSYRNGVIENIERFYGFGIYAKKYWNISNRFLINGRGGVDYGFSTLSEDYTDGTLFRVGFRPGLTYFFSPHFALKGAFGFIGYTSIELEDNEDFQEFYSKSKTFDAQFGMSEISLGISYCF